MTGTALRDALHEVASAGVGSVDDARLARVADRAKDGGQSPTAPRGGGHRRWVVAGLAVAAVAALVVVGVAQALRPVEVTPASGPGSLPDQIFPTREHILTMEQAPIGRVSMVYATSPMTAASAEPAWIAVGADSDQYRWIAPVDPANTNDLLSDSSIAAVSPDGHFVAVGYSGDDGPLFHVEVINTSTGVVDDVSLGAKLAPFGGEVQGLSWSPSSERLAVESGVITERLSDTARRWEQSQFMVDGLTNDERGVRISTVPGLRPGGGDQLVGWSGESPVIVSYTGRGVTMSDGGGFLEGVTQREGALRVAGGTVARRVGTIVDVPDDASVHGLSPSGTQFVGLSDPTPSVSGDGDWVLSAFQTSDGSRIWFNEKIPEFGVEIVGWTNDQTPVLFTSIPGKGVNDPSQTQLVEFGPQQPSTNGEILVDLSGGGGEQVERVAVAADVLAGGQVRAAEPPNQPWYDPRTLGPTMRDWILDHKVLGTFGLILLAGVAVFGVIRRRRAHRVVEVHG